MIDNHCLKWKYISNFLCEKQEKNEERKRALCSKSHYDTSYLVQNQNNGDVSSINKM